MRMKGRRTKAILTAQQAAMLLCPMISMGNVTPEETIYGKDGWYFYDHDGSMEDYHGTRFFTDSQLAKIKNSLLNVQQDLASRGIEFVVMLTPNKETIYPEYMPDSYGSHASYTRIDQLYDYLKNDLRVVYPKDDLIAAKLAYPQYDIYYRTDTHWNNIGGYLGARALARELGYSFPDLGSLQIFSDYFFLGDITEDMEPKGDIMDYSYTLSGYGPYAMALRDQDEYGNYYWYHTEGAPARTLTIYGDSYSLNMAPYMGQLFEDVYLHRFTEDKSLVDEENPSVVVYQILERFLDELV